MGATAPFFNVMLYKSSDGWHFKFAVRAVRFLKSKKQRYWIWSSQNGHCAHCGVFIDCDEAYHIDHIQPFSKGGVTELFNLQLLCPSCNLKKGASELEETCSSGCTFTFAIYQ